MSPNLGVDDLFDKPRASPKTDGVNHLLRAKVLKAFRRSILRLVQGGKKHFKDDAAAAILSKCPVLLRLGYFEGGGQGVYKSNKQQLTEFT